MRYHFFINIFFYTGRGNDSEDGDDQRGNSFELVKDIFENDLIKMRTTVEKMI